ncbi:MULTISPECIES: T9SS type A sorting domain-containing protein [unclassified Aureispira]|uniref:T9SS type A sorting domain-containing protein n=1 Tax=unclassified Aureispira TaxID=2649989 RepID=UPI0006969014|nr:MULTISPECIES: T9SS type A sorting domain-containing protein [unclassified Aureispira]WMX15639.1 T9SS type A sorting domain-containing protein [Aureispira sp. CCB-E]
MLKTILITTFLLVALLLQGQSSFHVSATYATKQGQIDKEVSPSVVLRNLTSKTIELSWEVKKSNLSEGWEAVVCDHQCYTSLVNKRTFKLEPNEVLHDFKISFRPNGKQGMGNIEVHLYDVSDEVGTEQIITFSAAAQGTHTAIHDFSKETTVPKVFPNPAIDYIHIKDDYNRVALIEIYNVVGRKMEHYSVNHAGAKYDVSSLPKGMYMVRMRDANGNIVRTQRISKYNP